MRDDDHGHAVIMQLVEEVQKRALRRGIEVSRGFIRKHDGGFRDQSTCDRHSLLLTTGQFARAVGRSVAQTDLIQRFERPLSSNRPGNPLIEQGHADVLHDVELADQVEGLEDEPDLPSSDRAELLVGEGGHVDPLEGVGPAGGSVEAAEQIHQGGFSGPGCAHDGEILPLRDVEIDPSKRIDENRPIRFEIGFPQFAEGCNVFVHRAS